MVVNLSFMIPKRDGHAAIRLFMIGMSSKKYPHVLLVDILTKRKMISFTSLIL